MARQEIINESLALSRPKIDQNFSELYTNLANIDTTVAWDEVQNKPATFPATWDEVSGKPTIYPTNWASVADKPATYPSTWESVSGKPATYPPSAHTHHNYQALLETNLDLLMRGLLYTRAQPFSQSFTFSGDGTRTAFKIPRASVQQQGWVRGGVSATVNGAAASGTWNIHTQTFTLSAAPANGTSVVISATDVVPYQGMAASADTIELVQYTPRILITTSGTGANTTHTNAWLPASVKLPLRDSGATDDLLLNDLPNAPGHTTYAPLMWVLESAFQSFYPRAYAGQRGQLEPSADPAARGKYAPPDWRFEGTLMSVTVPHLNYVAGLYRVVTAVSGSPFQTGELVLGVGGRFETTTRTLAILSRNNAFDLFRLNGGPITEAGA